MKKIIIRITSSISLILTGCATTSSDTEQTLGAVATVSAMAVALPLIPFAEAYHTINQTEKKLKAEREKWESILDPIYKERTKLILERSPETDAQELLKQNVTVYFPSLLGEITNFDLGTFYPGVENIWESDPDKKENYERVMSNSLSKYLWTLMSNDPAHENSESSHYFSGIYKTFISARFEYMEKFNLTMYHKIQQNSKEK